MEGRSTFGHGTKNAMMAIMKSIGFVFLFKSNRLMFLLRTWTQIPFQTEGKEGVIRIGFCFL